MERPIRRPIRRSLRSPLRRPLGSTTRIMLGRTKRTWRPTVAGHLTSVIGETGIFLSIILIFGGISLLFKDTPGAPYFFLLVIPPIVLGVIAAVGGYFARKRIRWGWALTGSIASLLIVSTFFTATVAYEVSWMTFVFGIILALSIFALILVIMSRNEFARKLRRFRR